MRARVRLLYSNGKSTSTSTFNNDNAFAFNQSQSAGNSETARILFPKLLIINCSICHFTLLSVRDILQTETCEISHNVSCIYTSVQGIRWYKRVKLRKKTCQGVRHYTGSVLCYAPLSHILQRQFAPKFATTSAMWPCECYSHPQSLLQLGKDPGEPWGQGDQDFTRIAVACIWPGYSASFIHRRIK